MAASITAEWTAVKGNSIYNHLNMNIYFLCLLAFALARLKEKQSLYAEAGALLQRANELIDEALSHQSKSSVFFRLRFVFYFFQFLLFV